jgi:hypothetical protein
MASIKVKPNYADGKIYKIVNPNNTKYYIGSTIHPLEKRYEQHIKAKRSFAKGNKSARELASFKLLEGGHIELLKTFPCKSRRELQKEEGRLIREHKTEITNFFVAGVSMHDWFKAYGVMKAMGKQFK